MNDPRRPSMPWDGRPLCSEVGLINTPSRLPPVYTVTLDDVSPEDWNRLESLLREHYQQVQDKRSEWEAMMHCGLVYMCPVADPDEALVVPTETAAVALRTHRRTQLIETDREELRAKVERLQREVEHNRRRWTEAAARSDHERQRRQNSTVALAIEKFKDGRVVLMVERLNGASVETGKRYALVEIEEP